MIAQGDFQFRTCTIVSWVLLGLHVASSRLNRCQASITFVRLIPFLKPIDNLHVFLTKNLEIVRGRDSALGHDSIGKHGKRHAEVSMTHNLFERKLSKYCSPIIPNAICKINLVFLWKSRL